MATKKEMIMVTNFVRNLLGLNMSNNKTLNDVLPYQEIFKGIDFSDSNLSKATFVNNCTLNNLPFDSALKATCLGRKVAEMTSVKNKMLEESVPPLPVFETKVISLNETINVNFRQNIIALEQALSVWDAFQSSFLYCNLMTGKVSTFPETGEESNRKNTLNLNALLIENEEPTWYIHKELEDDFKNSREIYCFVIGLIYMVDKLYPGFTVTPKQIQEVIAKPVTMYNLKEIEKVNTLDNIEKIMATFKVCFVL